MKVSLKTKLLIYSVVICLLINCFSTVIVYAEEYILQEQFIYEITIDETKLSERYIAENMLYEDEVYEYKIDQYIISQAYVVETIVDDSSIEEIESQLPEEISDYDIDWAKVISRFAIGTAIILVVGIVNHVSAGSSFFVFGSAASVAKDALVGGVIGAALNEVIGCVSDGRIVNDGVKKYAIEGFAEGFMWGAISSVLKIFGENFKRLKKFKLSTGDSLKINADGSVFNDSGQYIGKAYYDKTGTWFLKVENTHAVTAFDKSGKEIIEWAETSSLPKSARLRLGTDSSASVCYTDSTGSIYRIGDNLIPNRHYYLNDVEYITDNHGRIESVVFDKLSLKPEGRGRLDILDSMQSIGKNSARSTDQRGHLIADMFDGDNTLANIVPMDGTINTGVVKNIETNWQNCLRRGGSVRGTIKIEYAGGSFRPDSFVYSYDIGEGLKQEIIKNAAA